MSVMKFNPFDGNGADNTEYAEAIFSGLQKLKLDEDSYSFIGATIRTTFTGRNLSYEVTSGTPFPLPVTGVFDRLEMKVEGSTVWTISGWGMQAEPFFANLTASEEEFLAAFFSKSDRITMTGLADTVRGLGGNDTLFGGSGGDDMMGDNGRDSVLGGGGQDTIYGGAGRDQSFGGAGSDVLFGDDGNDRLYGGNGNDLASGGSGSDSLSGGIGDDTLAGNDEADTVDGGAGNDDLSGNSGDDVLIGGDGEDTLYGLESDDQLSGGTGADSLLGGSGRDRLSGGAAADFLDGEEEADRLSGDAGNDVIYGGEGNDTLYGGAGSDTMIGNAGSDRFVFDTGIGAAQADFINGFETGIDRMLLDKDIFGAAGPAGAALAAGRFRIGTSAQDAGDRIIYDSVTGKLWYDADGAGGAGKVQFALLNSGLALTAADFQVIG